MVLKVYRFQNRAFLLTVHGVNWRQHGLSCRIGKTKTNKMVFCTEDLVLIKVLRQEKGYHLPQLMNNHTALLKITVNVHESVLSLKLVCWTSNWKHVIKYDLYVKFSRIFAHNIQICAKFSCKNFTDVCPVFWILCHYTRGAFFRGHTVLTPKGSVLVEDENWLTQVHVEGSH